MKTAFIIGVTGQDGSYLAELLLEKGYKVYGLQRRSSSSNTERIDHLYKNKKNPNFITIPGDLQDGSSLIKVVDKISPDEIYNLGAQSHVKISFEVPEYTTEVTGIGALRLLDIIHQLNIKSKFYQAGSSEMFGDVKNNLLQNEETAFNPQSPYAVAKVFAHQITKVYRESYGIFASNGILFNHESPRRGENFVTRKITLGLVRVKLGLEKSLKLGNLESSRDWGYAKDYVEGMWMILQYKKPDDFVLATGETHTVREFVEASARYLDIEIIWQGTGLKEKGIDKKTGKIIAEVNPQFFRPLEVSFLRGDFKKAKQLLGWQPKVSFNKLIEIMTKADYDLVKQELNR